MTGHTNVRPRRSTKSPSSSETVIPKIGDVITTLIFRFRGGVVFGVFSFVRDDTFTFVGTSLVLGAFLLPLGLTATIVQEHISGLHLVQVEHIAVVVEVVHDPTQLD